VITFTPLARTAPAYENETVLDVARRSGVPLGNACGGVGVCTRCRVTVLAGAENLTPQTEVEIRFGRSRGFADDERMACQAVVLGECEVTTTYWG
jgi:adenylate cyclase